MLVNCPIASIDYLNHDTRKVLLKLPAGTPANFKAGQYLNVTLPTKQCPFSIASAPNPDGLVELHIRPTPNSEDSVAIETLLDSVDHLEIELPIGDCFIETAPDRPLLLLAASTGITQMKSIIEHLLKTGIKHPVYLYWGVVSDKDIYIADMCQQWSAREPQFHFEPVVSEPASSPNWQGKVGLVGEVALADFDDVSNMTVIVGGGPAMVYATLDMFVARGMPAENMMSDVFSYAPRPA